MSRFSTIASLLLVGALVTVGTGCGKKDDAATTGGAAPGAATSATAAGDEPVEQDFEDEAEASVNEGNLETELAKMESELKLRCPSET